MAFAALAAAAGLLTAAPLARAQDARLTAETGGRTAPVEWDWSVLGKAPQTYDAPPELKLGRPGLRALFYEGLPYKGRPTRVFAWLGIPEHKPGERLPAVVFIHGGGMTASEGAVRLWNSRGCVCLSMDTTGSTPGANLKRHEWGGPRGNGECFAQIKEPVTDQWMYHAAADVALANSLLRSLPDVDPGKVGVTGLSWGGVVTAVVAGVDDRFRWAAPVYGCGFLQASEYFKPVLAAYQGDRWNALWDPSQYLPRAKMPMLWVNGTNDTFFQLPIWQRSARLAPGPRTLSLRVRMPHGGPDGEKPAEILAFAESVVRDGEPLPKLAEPSARGGAVAADVDTRRRIARAELCVTRDGGPWSKRHWEALPAEVAPGGAAGRRRIVATLPAGARAWYLRVVTEDGLAVTTEPQGETAEKP